MMNYKGFIGVVKYDDARTVITFQGTTVDKYDIFIHRGVLS